MSNRIFTISRGVRVTPEMDGAIATAARARSVTEAEWLRQAIGTVLSFEGVLHEPRAV